jgi:hypothetical protein
MERAFANHFGQNLAAASTASEDFTGGDFLRELIVEFNFRWRPEIPGELSFFGVGKFPA